ncbi:hypothetical protein [Chondrinema litorale]|uniref:hypothetical protein n=1 Tax=Chondrinema litorale TaxID=2994555 RepID=UPI002542BDDF|nr:hypothetical protein [Chondrinema litorale]UZR97879.1 hypothetical protein OQ292_29120 [Chondrinema litorale]
MKYFKHYILGLLISLLVSANLFGQTAEEEHHHESVFCSLCKERITAKVVYSFGVTHLDLSEQGNKLKVDFRKAETNTSKIQEILIEAGYRFRILKEENEHFEAVLYPCKHELEGVKTQVATN